MTMGKLMDKMEGRFERYLGATMPLLIAALQNSEDYQVHQSTNIRRATQADTCVTSGLHHRSGRAG